MQPHDWMLIIGPPVIWAGGLLALALTSNRWSATVTPPGPKPVYCQHHTAMELCRRIQHPACRSGLCAKCCDRLGCGCMVVDEPTPGEHE